MKKKILLISLMVAMFVCMLAIGVSAATMPTEQHLVERTYYYYENEIADGNLLFSAKTMFAIDANNKDKYRFEIITSSSGVGFAKTDSEGNALTWYVVSDETVGDGFTRNIVVKSAKTMGEAGSVNANGLYTHGTGSITGITAKNVVSVNFFGTGVKSLSANMYQANATTVPNGNSSEYCQIADGSYLLALYLPETLTSIPDYLCYRAPIITLEFENNKSIYTTISSTAFNYCANLKAITFPEGIETLATKSFRECVSVNYVKFPSTMLRLENDVFWRSGIPETVILGANMTFAGYLNSDPARFYVDNVENNIRIKYFYIPNTITTSGSKFSAYRAGVHKDRNALTNITRDIVFFFAGTLEEAEDMKALVDEHFIASFDETTATNKGLQYNTPITYAQYLTNKEHYDNLEGYLLVYDVPSCIAFYDGHDLAQKNTYTDALTPFVIGDLCQRCDYSENATEYAPQLTFLGYSAQIGGDRVCLGYQTNAKSLEACPNVSYGVLAVAPGDADMTNYEPLNPDLTSNVENKLLTLPIGKEYYEFNFIIKGFDKTSTYYETPIVMCVYVTDGEKVDYLCHDIYNNITQQEYASSLTFKFISEELAPKYDVAFTCDDTMGTLTGATAQIVREGDKSSAVTAVAKDGYQFACWSDGTTNATIEYSPTEKSELVAYFTPKSTGLPVFTIDTATGLSITSKEDYVDCEITLLDTETGKSIGGKTAEIKGRGNSTWEKFDKKPYKLKFEDKQNLFGYGKEKTWVLLADARDYSLVRNMLALNAGLSMSELGYTSKGQSVELYLNGEYRGVYYLCEQIQVKDNRVDITAEDEGVDANQDGMVDPDSIGYLVEMDAWASDSSNKNLDNYTKDGDVFVTITGGQKPFVIKDPEDVFFDADGNFDAEKAAPYLEYIQGYLQECHDSMFANKTTDNYNALCELIDVKSFAQAYIILELFKNPDVNYSSVYYYKDAGGKLVADPLWDFDMSIGNVTHKSGAGTNASNFRDTTFLWVASQNYWFKQLLQFNEFRALVGQELSDNADNIRASIDADLKYAKAHAAAYEKNFEVWKLINNTSATEAMGAWSVPEEFKAFVYWEDHLNYIESYLKESLDYLITTYPAPTAE